MIARAPTSYRESMTLLVALFGTITRTADQFCSCSGETVGDSKPGVISIAADRFSSATT